MSSPFVPISDVAEHFKVNQATVRGWLKAGIITKNTYIHIGSTYRFNLAAITEALTTPEGEDVTSATWSDVSGNEETVPQLETDEDY
jgi:hypothetical protein